MVEGRIILLYFVFPNKILLGTFVWPQINYIQTVLELTEIIYLCHLRAALKACDMYYLTQLLLWENVIRSGVCIVKVQIPTCAHVEARG